MPSLYSCVFYLLCGVLIVCAQHDNVSNQIIDSINQLDNEQSVYLFGGLSIRKSAGGRSIYDDDNNKDYSMAEPIYQRTIKYLRSHEITFSLNNGAMENPNGMWI